MNEPFGGLLEDITNPEVTHKIVVDPKIITTIAVSIVASVLIATVLLRVIKNR